jgi:hypothetical protein
MTVKMVVPESGRRERGAMSAGVSMPGSVDGTRPRAPVLECRA